MWTQNVDPFNNLLFSSFVAIVPIIFIFWALVVKQMKGYIACSFACLLSLIIATAIYGMPVELAIFSGINGALYGLFPISWIIIAAMFLFNLTVKAGFFEILKNSIGSLTYDRRIQIILIGFAFGAFLEGTAGFGAPVAITAAMLVGLGFKPLYAAGLCLIANTAPVAFGSVGIPIIVAAEVTEIPAMAISKMVGRTLPLVALVIPFYLVVVMSGLKRAIEVGPAVLVAGFSFGILQWVSSNFFGPELPDIIAGVGTIIALIILLKYWQPKNIWDFDNNSRKYSFISNSGPASKISVIKSWSPFIVLTLIILVWGIPSVKTFLDYIGSFEFNFPVINDAVINSDGEVIRRIFKFNLLSAAGTAIFFSTIICFPIFGLDIKTYFAVFKYTVIQLKYPLITISSILAFAYIINDSGMSITIANTVSLTGILFPIFAPILGWLGVFITGSDTASNALFGNLQSSAASSIGIDPVVTVSANSSGGVVGKMISPQSIAVATAAGGIVGKESDLFKFTLKHSIFLLAIISIIVTLQSYIFKWSIPKYEEVEHDIEFLDTTVNYNGLFYLGALILLLIALMIFIKHKEKINK